MYLVLFNEGVNVYNKNRETLEAYVLGDDFKYFQNLKYLPLSVYPSNIQSALVVYCFSGKAKLGDVIILFVRHVGQTKKEIRRYIKNTGYADDLLCG